MNEDTSNLSIKVGQRQAAIYSGNQAYLQEECNRFIKALTYYLEHPEEVDKWHSNKPKITPESKPSTKETTSNGWYILIYIIIFGIVIGVMLI